MTQSAGQSDAAQISAQTARQQKELWDLASPLMRNTLQDFINDLGPAGSEPSSVKKAFDKLRTEQGGAFEQAKGAAPATVEQVAKQSGQRMDPGAVKYGSDAVLASLEKSRMATARATKEAEVDASMQQRSFLMSQILGLSEGGVGQSFGLTSNALNASQYNTKNPWGGALSGALSGASIGSAGGWVGAAAGALVGGVGGYFAGGG
jgi:hypothetical protein